ncbi:MAG TPA: 3,4-dihydroxy-2-butanone-4-phosphate synthase [Myxococcota bacterium]|nr:3,4-dihydroxy-2-butanone-4-phosphate synthase [Myxococcota bacterium]HQP95503.1 3,4-dihydroxy-2-butanone-4-phosphate synthase [Myxococcota bacterium]
MPLSTIEHAVEVLKSGGMVILVDDEDRENEGDLVAAADLVTPDHLAFMAKKARGLVCLAMDGPMCDRIGLDMMVRHNTAPLGTAFTVSIDAREGVRTGISAQDRAVTIRKAVDEGSTAQDFVCPGSVFPLRAVRGGVLSRTGQTEGSVDLARLAGLRPAGVICEIMDEDGTMMRLPALLKFGEKYGLPVCTVADIISYRLKVEQQVTMESHADLPTDFGAFTVYSFSTVLDDRTHLALVMGDITGPEPVLVRVHRANFPGDIFNFVDGMGRDEVARALSMIAASGRGVFLYLNREETGSELLATLRRLEGEKEGEYTLRKAVGLESRMTFRDFGIGAQILRALGVQAINLITRNPGRYSGLTGFGLKLAGFTDFHFDESGTDSNARGDRI